MCKSPYIHERKKVINHTTDRVGSGGDALQMLTCVVTEKVQIDGGSEICV